MDRRDASPLRRYPPLFVIAAAVVLAIVALPSALNLPQANPGQVAEYAPVQGGNKAPPGGNVAALGLGEGGSAEGGGTGQSSGNSVPGVAAPTSFQCVGNPPRQTEDPLSPPCVPYFAGDNGGSTYQGVTAHEVRVLFYINSGTYYGGPENSQGYTAPPDTYVDVSNPADPNASHVLVRILRGWQTYFDRRYQTYGRFVHFYVFFTDGNNTTPEKRQADAADNFKRLHPFAVLTTLNGPGANETVYLQAMAQRGVLDFGSYFPRPSGFFQQYPGLVWSYPPSVEELGQMYASYVCTKVVHYGVSFSGNPGDVGKPRRLGLLYSTDPGRPDLQLLSRLVQDHVQACGGTFAAVDTFGTTGQFTTNPEASTNMADFVRKGVTTVIWPGGLETNETHAAAAIGYYPEWVMAGDGQTDGNGQMIVGQDATEWSHAWTVSAEPLILDYTKTPCYQAYRSVDGQASESEVQSWGCRYFYDGVRQLFNGVQVAGPKLTPAAIDQGFHAIPRVQLNLPSVPTCYYLAGDYSCVKDAIAEWWDPAGTPPGQNGAGCYRAAQGGRRYLAGGWPSGDVMTQKSTSSDPCNSYSGIT